MKERQKQKKSKQSNGILNSNNEEERGLKKTLKNWLLTTEMIKVDWNRR